MKRPTTIMEQDVAVLPYVTPLDEQCVEPQPLPLFVVIGDMCADVQGEDYLDAYGCAMLEMDDPS